MALRMIRYGGGVWKQHEEQRARLEARVRELESQLAQQQLQLDGSQQTQAHLSSALDASERHALELERLLQLRAHENMSVSVELAAANERLADSTRRVEQLDRDLVALQHDRERQDILFVEAMARAERFERQVDASRDEDARLCELLYAAQEKCEAHELELARCQREVRILTRANHVLTRQSDTLAKDKHTLAQQLARMRSANPSARTAVASPDAKRKCSVVSTLQLPTTTTLHERAESPMAAAAGMHQDDAHESNNGHASGDASAPAATSSSASFVWKQLQLASVKLQREQHTTAQLRERIAALEASERALTVRFREASAARRRVEQQQQQQRTAARSA